ncbi:hypothetical protein [Salinirussus salinus]|uniref:hypothetical protein n=1 Tax=Salinirussus salinus TaxID=1198300 RepID=UPI00135B3B4C|nr:hypothetical protein [Salinirussus salinus]
MKREDERILEYLCENGRARPALIANETFEKVSAAHVGERLAYLRHAGLVDTSGLHSYELTEAGLRYLDGDLDAAHQPRPTVDRVLRG